MIPANEAEKLIDAAGGAHDFAVLLGLDDVAHHRQLVTNWRRRGIPSLVVVQHYDLLQRLRKELPKRKAS